MAVSHKVDEFRKVVLELEAEFQPYHIGEKLFDFSEPTNGLQKSDENSFNLSLPPWICQPYIRLEPDEHKRVMAEKVLIAEDPERIKREFFDDVGNKISRKLSKKLKRVVRRPNYVPGTSRLERYFQLCTNNSDCVNPVVRIFYAFFSYIK